MGLNVGAAASGSVDSFKKFSLSRFAYKHLFVIENKIEGAEMPSLFVLRGVFPFNEVQTFPIERDNSNTYYPELVDVNDVEIEFYETMDNLVWNFFGAWHNMIFAHNTKDNVVFNLPDKFKRNIYVFRLDTMTKEGETDMTRVFGYEYSGCFPKRISDYPLDMSDPGAVNLSITFSCDNVRRLKSGHGIGTPQMLDRASVQLGSNPIEGKIIENKSRDAERQQAELLWRETESKIEIKAAKDRANYELRKNTVDLGLWVQALLKAAAQTGINIATREAYYLARAALKKTGVTDIVRDVKGGVVSGIEKARAFPSQL